MTSFLVSVGVFILFVGVLGWWQYRTRRTVKLEATQIDQEICNAAEVAQRRHVWRFGRANTDLDHTLKQSFKRTSRTTTSHAKL